MVFCLYVVIFWVLITAVNNKPVVDRVTSNNDDDDDEGMADDFDLDNIRPLELWIDEQMSETMFSVVIILIILITISIVFFTICFYKGRDVLLEKDDTEEQTAIAYLASSFRKTKANTLNSVKSKLPKEAHIYFEPKRLRQHMELVYDLYQELPDDDISSKEVKAIYKEVDQDPTLHLPELGELFSSLDQAVEKKKEPMIPGIPLQETKSKKAVAFLDEFQQAVKQLAAESSSLEVSKSKKKSVSNDEEKRPISLDEAQSLIKLEKLRSVLSLELNEESTSEEEIRGGPSDQGNAEKEPEQLTSGRKQKDERSQHQKVSQHRKDKRQKRKDKSKQKKAKRHERKNKNDNQKDKRHHEHRQRNSGSS